MTSTHALALWARGGQVARVEFPSTTPQRRETGPRGTLTVITPAAPLVLFVAQGHLDVGLAQHIVTSTNATLQRVSRPVVFQDWELLTGYDSASRELLTRYVQGIQAQLGGAHILVKSRLVSMGVAVANALLGGSLLATSSRARFDAALQDVLMRPAIPASAA